MSDFAPPSGPPPPKVPEGWKAVWNDQYKEWFFVNLYTKQSQWDRPESPAVDPNSSSHAAPPNDAPPSYGQGGHNAPVGAGIDTKSSNLHSNTPYSQHVAESDEAMARRLQEEEDRRISADKTRGASDSYYNNGSNQGYPNAPNYGSQQSPQQVPASGTSTSSGSRGFLSKIKEKMQNPAQRPMGAPMMGYNAGGYPPQQYGGYPQQGYPQQGYPQQGYGRPMGMGMGGYGQPVKKKGGLGAGGAAALGVGGGLVGGMLLMDGIDDMQDNAYDQGYDQGMDDGGDFGGGDF